MELTSESKQQRVEIANKFLKIISDHGRRFFYNKSDGFVSKFIIKGNHVFLIDHYSRKHIYVAYKYGWKGFTNGGTMKGLIQALYFYIKGERELPLNHISSAIDFYKDGGDMWGYGNEILKQVLTELKSLQKLVLS